MKLWVKELLNEKSGLQIAPLIDVVFLLLILVFFKTEPF